MTANVQIIAHQRENVLRIPNAALRFRPQGEAGKDKPAESKQPAGEQIVYRLVADKLTLVKVFTGITDNKFTEVLSGDLKVGDPLVVADLDAEQAQKDKEASRFRIF
jgi:HlyD family secretion protein